ncbi:GntR family transcriptional regulator [Lapidilactobacillus dextrinicus]|uniref:GntR family transcriptional regulator n=1 Tax=Lapidilactobacillus dextrinicus TaxID=51664 RepID=UPI003F21CF5E
MESKYEYVKKKLLEQILSGKYTVNDKLPTESELMAQYHVSRYSVRRAVGELESENYVYRIQGGGIFVSDWSAKESGQLKNKMIGVITTHLANYIFPNIITGIDRTLSKNGYSILLSNTQNNPEKERQAIIKMMENDLSGLIIEPTQSAVNKVNFDLYDRLEIGKLPVMFINAHYDELNFPFIEMNDESGEEQITDYLFKNHHKHVLGVFKTDDLQGIHRMNGFIKSCQKHSASSYLSEVVMYTTGDDMQQIFKRVEQILLRNDHPTAIACYNDQLAIQLIALIKTLGLAVPTNISIVGFDNYQLSEFTDPSLTSINHLKEQLGRDAGSMILDMINRKEVKSIIYPPELIVRHSVRNLE